MRRGGKPSWSILTHTPWSTSTSGSRSLYKLTRRADRILADWKALEQRAGKVYDQLGERKLAFYEMIYVQILLQTNLHELYNAGECIQSTVCRS